MATIYLPFYIKRKEGKKKEYEIVENENSFLLRYINNLKNTKSINLLWVGMLQNYFDFEEDEIDSIDEFLSQKDFCIIRPKKETGIYFYFISKELCFPYFIIHQ